MALIQLNRTKTGARPTALADGELYIDQYNGLVWWADSTGRLRNGALGGMPPGTRMLFQQTAAPLGWKKLTTHDNKALRVVSGQANVWGTVGFDSVFGSGAVTGATTLTTDQIPSHNHSFNDPGHDHFSNPKNHKDGTVGWHSGGSGGWAYGTYGSPTNFTVKTDVATTGITIQAVGGGQSHTHPMLDLAYIDVILAEKE